MLFIDSRESKTLQQLVAVEAGPAQVLKLECADFVLFDADGHSLGIERKEVGDFLNSLREKQANGNRRLADQLERMADTYTHRLLVVEGGWSYESSTHTVGTARRGSGWLASVIFLVMWGITASGTPVLPTSGREHTAEVLRILHKRSLAGCVLPSALRDEEEQAV